MERGQGVHSGPREPTAEPACRPSTGIPPAPRGAAVGGPAARPGRAPTRHPRLRSWVSAGHRMPALPPGREGRSAAAALRLAPAWHGGSVGEREFTGRSRPRSLPGRAALRCAGAARRGERCENRSVPSRIPGSLDPGLPPPCPRRPAQARRCPRGEAGPSPARSAQTGARGSPAGRAPRSGGPGGSLRKTRTQPEKRRHSPR
ncbi:uncharacterized protein LOC142406288 [Mycteria americana]|uniref:uncharacterized protein LOC142406288 n=1 Tax=Mycteria americana TaxID=33587 RepID=UPI003F58A696